MKEHKAGTFSDNKLVIVIAVAVVLIVLVLILKAVSGKGGGGEEPSSEIIVSTVEETPVDPSQYELKKDAIPALNELVNTYFTAMKDCDAETYTNIVAGDDMTAEKLQKKGEFIEDYQNISCYTKPGMTEGSYVTFVYYEVKFRNVDTLAPALSQLYVCTNEDGTMYINAGSVDPELAGYINTVGSDEQVLQLKEDTEQKLTDACASDEKLAVFVEKLIQGAGYEPEPEISQEETQPVDIDLMTFEDRDEQVLTTTTVRYRSTPTTESDDNVIGKIEANTKLHRIGYNSSWSKIEYEGQEVYISSDYLITN